MWSLSICVEEEEAAEMSRLEAATTIGAADEDEGRRLLMLLFLGARSGIPRAVEVRGAQSAATCMCMRIGRE